MRRTLSDLGLGCKKLYSDFRKRKDITLWTVCQDISDASFVDEQTRLDDHQLVNLVMNLDPKWQDTVNVPTACIAPMRGMDSAQLAIYILKNFPEQWLRMYHQNKGLAPVLAGGGPTIPGIYTVSYPGGARYRDSPRSDNCVAVIAEPDSRVTIIRVQCDRNNGREMGLVQETNMWLPTRLASGERVLIRVSETSLETSLETRMEEDSAYTHTDEMSYTHTDDMSVMSNDDLSEEVASPTAFTMTIQIDS